MAFGDLFLFFPAPPHNLAGCFCDTLVEIEFRNDARGLQITSKLPIALPLNLRDLLNHTAGQHSPFSLIFILRNIVVQYMVVFFLFCFKNPYRLICCGLNKCHENNTLLQSSGKSLNLMTAPSPVS